MTITAAAPLAASKRPVASISPLGSSEKTLETDSRSALLAFVSGSRASAWAMLANATALKITETANQITIRRTGTGTTACSKWSMALSSPVRSRPIAASAWKPRLR